MVPLHSCLGGMMAEDMGTIRTDIEVENPVRPSDRAALRQLLVDTGGELSWVPASVLDALGVARKKV